MPDEERIVNGGPKVLAIVLAGGEGGRLMPLTERRAKPVVPFAGTYRLIDFALSNLVHAGLSDIWIVEQYLPWSLNDHLAHGRPWDLDRTEGGLQILPPHSGGEGPDGMSEGNADALYRNIGLLRAFAPDVILTMSADHVVKFDVAGFIASHLSHGSAVTMGTKSLPDEDVSRYAVVGVEGDHVVRFEYKPEAPEGHTVCTEAFAFDAERLLAFFDEHGHEDLKDYGHELLPHFVDRGEARAFPVEGYWRDVGTIESYWQGHMDLLDPAGDPLAFGDPAWPMRTNASNLPPARILPGASVEDAWLSPAGDIAGTVRRSIVGPNVRIEAGALVEESVILENATIRAGATVRRAIVDAGAIVEGECIGGDEIAVAGTEDTGPEAGEK